MKPCLNNYNNNAHANYNNNDRTKQKQSQYSQSIGINLKQFALNGDIQIYLMIPAVATTIKRIN